VDLCSPFNSGTAYLLDEVGVVLFTAMPMALRESTSGCKNLKISGFDMRSISSVVSSIRDTTVGSSASIHHIFAEGISHVDATPEIVKVFDDHGH